MESIGAILQRLEAQFKGLGVTVRRALSDLLNGPLSGLVLRLVLSAVGAWILVKGVLTRLDKMVGVGERALVVVATLAMTGLVFNGYLMEQKSSFQQAPQSETATKPETTQPKSDTPAKPINTSRPSTPAPNVDLTEPVAIELVGEATDVTLTSADGKTFAVTEEIKPGSYSVKALFDGWDEPDIAGEVEILGGSANTLKCDPFTYTCRIKKKRKVKPATAKPTSSTVSMTVAGDATRVSLHAGQQTYELPGDIPTGAYQVIALFDGWDEPGDAGTVEVGSIGPVTLKCDSFTYTCRVKKKRKPPGTVSSTSPASIEVTVTGDATKIEFHAQQQKHPVPGKVAAGTYQVTALFDGWDEPGDAGTVEIGPDGPFTLKCDSFTYTCRIKKKRKQPIAAQTSATAIPAEKSNFQPSTITVSGGGNNHQLHSEGTVFEFSALIPPGNYVISAEFEDIGRVTAGSIEVPEEPSSIEIYCDESTWQCVEDSGWWNIWEGEGQLNLALMLMVAMGFLGASIATTKGKHLAVDATDRVLSPRPARLVKRITSLIAAGLCFILMNASWEKIIDPDASGSTFPSSKVWWWMVAPINFVTGWLPGDKYGPGTGFSSRTAWEDAMIQQGQEWPFGLAYSYVKQGDGFPLWIPVFFLVFTFGIMGMRFLSQAISPPTPASLPPKPGRGRTADIIIAGAFPGALIALGLAVWMGQGFMIIVASVILVLMGSPLFIAVGVGTLAGWIFIRDASATTLINDMFEATKKQEIIAIPFFVFAGNIMTNGSIAKRLIAFAQALVGSMPGGLGVAAVLACAVFAAISGSSPATVIAIGAIMFPMLIKNGYTEKFSLGLLSTSGSLGIIIPPSVPMIIYAVMVSNPTGPVGIISPTELFKGGFIPGLFIALALVTYTVYVNWPRPSTEGNHSMEGRLSALPWLLPAPVQDAGTQVSAHSKKEDVDTYWINLGKAFIAGVPSLMLPVLVLGGIYGQLPYIAFDVTQAAAIAVVYALFVELFIHRELKLRDVPGVCVETATMIGSLFLILVIAISLNKLLVLMDVPQQATDWMLSYTDSPLTFLIMVNIFLLALGCVMDIISAILIVAPLLAPIAAQYGIHPIHFGIMFIVNLELGYLTPPMGINLFVASTTFERPLLKVIKAIFPFLLLMLFCLISIVWLPRWFESSTCVSVPGLPAYTESFREEQCGP